MDATRRRRLRDSARRDWYARWRSFRFARHLGFASLAAAVLRPESLPLRRSGLLANLPSPGTTKRLCA
jgi:hypothetical protein